MVGCLQRLESGCNCPGRADLAMPYCCAPRCPATTMQFDYDSPEGRDKSAEMRAGMEAVRGRGIALYTDALHLSWLRVHVACGLSWPFASVPQLPQTKALPSTWLSAPPAFSQVRAEADTLRRDLTQQTQRLSELTSQLEQERGQSEWPACSCVLVAWRTPGWLASLDKRTCWLARHRDPDCPALPLCRCHPARDCAHHGGGGEACWLA